MRKRILSMPMVAFLKPFFASLVCITFMASTIAPATYSQDKGKWRSGPIDALISTTDKTIKGTFLYDSDADGYEGLLIGMNFKLPASESEGNVESLLNDFSESWRLGPYLAKEFSIDKNKLFIDFSPQWSFRKYVYYPDFSYQQESLTKHDLVLGSSLLYYSEPTNSAISAIQIKLEYGVFWMPSDATSEVIDTGVGYSKTGKPKIIDPPKAKSEFSARAFYYRETKAGSSWATGFSLAFAADAPSDGSSKWPEDTSVIREEFWLYRLPLVNQANMRLGFGIFASQYLNGESNNGRKVVPGLLLQVKFGVPLYSY